MESYSWKQVEMEEIMEMYIMKEYVEGFFPKTEEEMVESTVQWFGAEF